MVEAAGALGILFLIFVCIFHIFLMSIDKIRSLDTVYHLARANQVNRGNDLFITHWCFPGGRWMPSQTRPVRIPGGPPVQETVIRFFPHGLHHLTLPWKSVMRGVQSNTRFLSAAWPSAPDDPSVGFLAMEEEKALAVVRMQANEDTTWDHAEEAVETLGAEHG